MIDLRALHRELLDRHGPQGWWWPGEEPFEIALGAVLVQRSRWEQAAQALAALTAAGLREPARLASADEEHVRELVRPAGFPRTKPRRVQALATWWAGRAAAADETVKLIGAGVLPSDSQVTYDRLGLDAGESAILRADTRRTRSASMLERLTDGNL